jgi:hypothetical protein
MSSVNDEASGGDVAEGLSPERPSSCAGEVRRIVAVVADRVLPIAPLPDAAFAATNSRLSCPLAASAETGRNP